MHEKGTAPGCQTCIFKHKKKAAAKTNPFPHEQESRFSLCLHLPKHKWLRKAESIKKGAEGRKPKLRGPLTSFFINHDAKADSNRKAIGQISRNHLSQPVDIGTTCNHRLNTTIVSDNILRFAVHNLLDAKAFDTKISVADKFPFACKYASFVLVPVPHGERST